MSNEKTSADPVVQKDRALESPATSFDLTLDEFCRRLSAGRAGPELIGGFHHAQVAAGKVKASDAEFTAAFERFSTQPA